MFKSNICVDTDIKHYKGWMIAHKYCKGITSRHILNICVDKQILIIHTVPYMF